MRSQSMFFFQRIIFARLRIRFFDFGCISPQPRGFLGGRHGGSEFFAFFAQSRQSLPDTADFCQFFFIFAETVQHIQLIADFEQMLIFMCAVNVNHQFAQTAQNLESNRGFIQKIPAGGGSDDPADQQRAVLFGLNTGFFQQWQNRSLRTGGQGKFPGDFTARRADTDHGPVRPFAQQQTDAAHDDGFSRAGFAADDIEPGTEFHVGAFHQSEVFQMHPLQHDDGPFRGNTEE